MAGMISFDFVYDGERNVIKILTGDIIISDGDGIAWLALIFDITTTMESLYLSNYNKSIDFINISEPKPWISDNEYIMKKDHRASFTGELYTK